MKKKLIYLEDAIDEALLFLVEYCGAAFDEDMQEQLSQRLKLLPSVPPKMVCVAKITLSDEQIQEAVEKAKSEVVKELQSAEPERKTGRWHKLDDCANEGVYCSKCHKKVFPVDFSNTMKRWKNYKYCKGTN